MQPPAPASAWRVDASDRAMNRIVLGVDGSAGAQAALDFAVAEAALCCGAARCKPGQRHGGR